MSDPLASRPEGQTAKPPGRGRLWLTLHGWFALPIWAFLFFVCVTGTLASVSREIAWLVDPRVRASNPEDRPRVGYDAMADAMRREYPDAEVLWIHEDEPYLAAFVGVGLPDAVWGTAYVNPYTAEVQGLTKGLNFPELMRELHGWLLLPWTRGTSIGYYLVGAMAVALIGLIVTGFKVHKRVWRTLRRPPRLRTDRGARVWWGDLHRVVGAWALWFGATISVTGTWFLTQGILWDAEIPFEHLAAELARDDMPVVTRGAPPPERIALDEVAAAARTVAPALDITWLVVPVTPYGTFEVLGEDGPAFMGDYATAVYLNPWTGDVVESYPVGSLGPVGIVDHMADPLHYGNFAGLWSRLIWFVFGCGLSALMFSGMMVWTKRTALAARRGVEGDRATPLPVQPREPIPASTRWAEEPALHSRRSRTTVQASNSRPPRKETSPRPFRSRRFLDRALALSLARRSKGGAT